MYNRYQEINLNEAAAVHCRVRGLLKADTKSILTNIQLYFIEHLYTGYTAEYTAPRLYCTIKIRIHIIFIKLHMTII